MKRLIPIAVVALCIHHSMQGENSAKGPDRGQPSAAPSDSVASISRSWVSEIGMSAREDFTLRSSPGETGEPVHPRSLVFRTDLVDEAPLASGLSETDSLPPPVQRKLLPDNLSLMERGLWGEGGILRGIGIASPLTPEVRKHELAVRRTMLTMHQIGGFLTLGSMIATDYFGQMSLSNRDTGQRDDPYRSRHQTFVTSTIILYSATGLLAILSPPPLIRRDETSTTSIHKTLAWIHVAGMVLTPLIGNTILKRGPVGRYADLNQARFHQISAYATTAVFAASMIVVTF